MNEIDWLVEQLKTHLPDTNTTVDEPEKSNGNHWLDVKKDNKFVTVEWRPGQGFGFFTAGTGGAGYHEGPEEIIIEKEKALTKIVTLFQP